MARKPVPKYKHLTAFSQTSTPRGTNLQAFILCGRRLTIAVQYTNDPDGDSNCAACKRCCEDGLKSGRLTRGRNPLVRTAQVLYYN